MLTHFERLNSSTIVHMCFGLLPHVLPCNVCLLKTFSVPPLLFSFITMTKVVSVLSVAAGAPANRRGRGGGHRGRGRFNVRRDGPMKFEKDFDFESANAQFNKEEIDREFQSKLKLKGI